ncbi:MAG: histidine--tRNA ligase [Bacteroidota bacterium]
MSVNYSIPRGTRDFGPEEMQKRNFIFTSLRSTFEKFGYQPIETPSMENLSTLLGKYGEEGDKLLFRILNSGDFLSDVKEKNLDEIDRSKLAFQICEKGLRYDLTVPFARFVVMHRNDIVFPFKRYQIQPVWRADKPQKGRYREFFQCDVDVIGSDSLINECELIQIIAEGFSKLKIKITIKLNNRKVLSGMAEYIGFPDKLTDITIAIDKIEKAGLEKANEELLNKGLSQDAVTKLQPLLSAKPGNNDELLSLLENILKDSEEGKKGIQEVRDVLSYVKIAGTTVKIEYDPSLARGLNYYTGSIFEVKADGVEMGSICGGGRYDNLTGIFGMPGVSGVGVSFGADRIYDVMNELNVFPATVASQVKALFVNFGNAEACYCLPLLDSLRKSGISAELYPDSVKMKKQLGYADQRKIPYVILVGEDEMKSGILTIKNMTSGLQEKMTIEELKAKLEAEEFEIDDDVLIDTNF